MLKIVAATDFSTRSQRALRRAGLLARQAAAELTLVHVVDDDQPQEMVEMEWREAKRYLNELIGALAELRGIHCRPVVATGEAFSGILETAGNLSADLIVMGSHRKQQLRDIFVGTTIERVMRTGPYPVLMVNREADSPYGSVLAAIDLSEPSADALASAKSLGLLDKMSVTVVHAFIAVAAGKLYVANTPKDQIGEYIASEQKQAREELSAFLAVHQLGGPGWSHRVEEGQAFDVISRVVSETMPDLVVIGTHGRSGITKLLLGSVAEQVLRSLDVDILAVPPRR